MLKATVALILLLASVSQADDLVTEPPLAPSMMALSPIESAGASSLHVKTPHSNLASEPQPTLPIGVEEIPNGFKWSYSNGGTVNETFAQYSIRTGNPSKATHFQCSSGFCGTPASSPTVACEGCACGCNAGECNCAHSPNVGKPLEAQKVPASEASTIIRRRQSSREVIRTTPPAVYTPPTTYYQSPSLYYGQSYGGCVGGNCGVGPVRGFIFRRWR